ncbi:MAG: TIM barrel protein [Clostridia bacterium]
MEQIYFGPGGNCDRFYAEGYASTTQAPAWLKGLGLNAYEYAAGRGVTVGEKTARAIGAAACESGIALSLHAPYYINCATPDADKHEKSLGYLLDAARACDWMGGARVVFHVGSPTRLARDEANRLAHATVEQALRRLDDNGLGHIHLCPETMGRASQLGTLEETLQLCLLDERMIPTLDFGHLHTIGLGALNTRDDFRRVLERTMQVLGARARHFHAHFSKIDFTAKGEKRHLCFSDADAGPDFALLAPLLDEYQLFPTIICESSGTQADDAITMRDLYRRAARHAAQD